MTLSFCAAFDARSTLYLSPFSYTPTSLMDSLQEYIGLADELRTQFAAGDDAALVTAAVAARAELDAAAAAREGAATSELERKKRAVCVGERGRADVRAC